MNNIQKKSLNRGRNVVNIEALKINIKKYANEKKLSLAVSSWLEKSFLRWMINSFPYFQTVQTKEHYKVLIKENPPVWFLPENKQMIFIYIDIKHSKFQEVLDKCSEFLGSRDKKIEHKFPRMKVEQILLKWEEEHQRMLRREKFYKETSTEGLERVFDFENMHIVKLRSEHKELSLEMARESALMQHCLGEFDDDVLGEGGYGEYYLKQIQNKTLEVYSLRDEKNMPHATISLYHEKGKYQLEQIKGKQNEPPIAKYVAPCVAFFNFLDVSYAYHSDTLEMGVVYLEGKTRKIEEVEDEDMQQFLLTYNSSFIHLLPNPSKATLWLASLRNPACVAKLEESTDMMKVASLLQYPLLMLKLKWGLPSTPKELSKGQVKYKIKERLFSFMKLRVGRV